MTDKTLLGRISSLTRAVEANTSLLGQLLKTQLETQAILLDMVMEQPEPDTDEQPSMYLNGQRIS